MADSFADQTKNEHVTAEFYAFAAERSPTDL